MRNTFHLCHLFSQKSSTILCKAYVCLSSSSCLASDIFMIENAKLCSKIQIAALIISSNSVYNCKDIITNNISNIFCFIINITVSSADLMTMVCTLTVTPFTFILKLFNQKLVALFYLFTFTLFVCRIAKLHYSWHWLQWLITVINEYAK